MACLACGYGDNPADANFCENCGAAITPDAPALAASIDPSDSLTVLPTAYAPGAETVPLELPAQPSPTAWTCACGRQNPAAEEFCDGCGEGRPATVAPMAPGDTLAGFEIVAETGPQTFAVRSLAGAGSATGDALLTFGPAEQLAETAATLAALSVDEPGTVQSAALTPRVLAMASDPVRGAYLVLSRPDGIWYPADAGGKLEAGTATVLLQDLLLLAGRAAQSGRLLLLSPAALTIDGERAFLARPIAPTLPLVGPLIAEPALIAPELRSRERDVDAWHANAYNAAATVQRLTGNALGFGSNWHVAMKRLLAVDPDIRPASAEEAIAPIAYGAKSGLVSMHRAASRTDIGHHHPVNQDAGGVWTWQRWDGTPVTLAIVADGVSAGIHSEDAAALTVDLFQKQIEQHWGDRDFTPDRAEQLLVEAGLQAQQQVCSLPMNTDDDASATTLVAVCLLGTTAVGLWCGDSRAYGVTPEGLQPLSRDHSWVNIMVDSGQMTLERAKADRRAHVIARWLGCSDPPRDDPGIDRFRSELTQGDRLLLCSDGLYMYYEAPAGNEAELVETIYRHGDDVSGAVTEVVDTALDRGGFDNITAVLVAIG